MSCSLLLESTFVAPRFGNGIVRLRLVNAGPRTFSGFRVVFSSIVPLTPSADSDALLVRRIGTCHEIAVPDGSVLRPGCALEIGSFDCEYQLAHANDGPVRAYLITDDGATVPLRVVPTERLATMRVGDEAPVPLILDQPTDITASAWAVAAGCERRLYPHDATTLATSSPSRGVSVTAGIDTSLGIEAFRLETTSSAPGGATDWRVTAGSPVAMQWAFMELGRRQRAGGADVSRGDVAVYAPRHGFRGLMVDLARHFHPAADIEHVLDLAAWRRLNVVHLHLTDDQAWRIPITAYPALGEIGAWRGHGLPIPPQNGSGADVYGGCYSIDDITRWIAAASRLGIELIPEIDVPGHCYSALVAVPELRDPDDSGDARSVQNFPRNVLNPGLLATRLFLENVFGELGDLFPGSPLHIGCDEVPAGAWDSSPATRAYAADRGLSEHRQVEAAFVAEIVEIVRRATGRRIGAWQEAAESGGMRQDTGYVVGWKSADDCQRLAAAGYEVVAAPGAAYYLDMATGPDWQLPGMWWAGHVTSESIAQFDVTAGWSESARRNLAGIQACLWGEHVSDRPTLRAMLLPRLDTFGDAGWTVGSVG